MMSRVCVEVSREDMGGWEGPARAGPLGCGEAPELYLDGGGSPGKFQADGVGSWEQYLASSARARTGHPERKGKLLTSFYVFFLLNSSLFPHPHKYVTFSTEEKQQWV